MDIKLIHLYPELMDLYGSRANLLVLWRALEALGNRVTVSELRPGDQIDLSQGDFLFLGAGTERAQKFCLEELRPYAQALSELKESTPMLFCGTAMELLGRRIEDAEGNAFEGLGLGDFTVEQGKKPIVGDVIGTPALEMEPIVGFMNTRARIHGVEQPFLKSLSLGTGNEAPLGPEGLMLGKLLGSSLTGPLLVKNPQLLKWVVGAIYEKRGEQAPEEIPTDTWAQAGYEVTLRELSKRVQK